MNYNFYIAVSDSVVTTDKDRNKRVIDYKKVNTQIVLEENRRILDI